jgi:hypothetical protein
MILENMLQVLSNGGLINTKEIQKEGFKPFSTVNMFK